MWSPPFAEFTHKTDPKTYKKLIQGIGSSKERAQPSYAGHKMTPPQKSRVAGDILDVLGVKGKNKTKMLAKLSGDTEKKLRSYPNKTFKMEGGSFQDVARGHQKKIAISTLKMPDAMVGVMGGMNKQEARKFLGLKPDGSQDDKVYGNKTLKMEGKPWSEKPFDFSDLSPEENKKLDEHNRAAVERAGKVTPGEKAAKAKARARENRRARDDAYRSLGLKKVKGALGGTYWE
jgi:hypothetical protein